jgi:hypothetical protein
VQDARRQARDEGGSVKVFKINARYIVIARTMMEALSAWTAKETATVMTCEQVDTVDLMVPAPQPDGGKP